MIVIQTPKHKSFKRYEKRQAFAHLHLTDIEYFNHEISQVSRLLQHTASGCNVRHCLPSRTIQTAFHEI